MSQKPPLKTWLPSWIFVSFVWGLSFLFIKFALNGLSALQVAFSRVGLGAITVLIILLFLKQKLPK
ncbi:MAG: EamA family transporter, partial [Actinomycetes bacterium]